MCHGGEGWTYYRYESPECDIVAILEVTFHQADFHPTTFNRPAEGGEIEIIDVTLRSFTRFDDNGRVIQSYSDLSKDQIRAFETHVVAKNGEFIVRTCEESVTGY